ncbi:thrombopoietin isoform X4 [Genypterus blacodes]|uniref:thrombopoietin isoform X4 n=1 Tax=Genypterus blacodes TaxID=154954 RepID=UPI003F76672B
MALSRLLLLCMVASEVWDVQTRPIDFVCNRDARRAMNIVAEMEAALPQEQRGDIVASLKLLIEDVKVLKAASQPGCTSSLLHRLERSINNYLRILTHLELSQGPAESPALSCVPQSTQSLSTILWTYNRLLSGKLEGLMDNLADKCTPQ